MFYIKQESDKMCKIELNKTRAVGRVKREK